MLGAIALLSKKRRMCVPLVQALFCTLLCALLMLALMPPLTAHAKQPQSRTKHSRPSHSGNHAPIRASLLVDATTGKILHQRNAEERLHPASLTKMMTLYLTFEALKSRKLHLDQQLVTSPRAASAEPSNLKLLSGERITVRQAIMALIVKSANDVSIVLAEAIKGSEAAFSKEMIARARMLGMKHTVFKNAHGLPHAEQITTAYDMAKLAIALRRDFPNEYRLFSHTSFLYKGRKIEGHNRITKHYPGADGLKTGYTLSSGFNIVSSAVRGAHRVVVVVMGGKTASERDRHARHLLDHFFREKQAETLVARNDASPSLVNGKKVTRRSATTPSQQHLVSKIAS